MKQHLFGVMFTLPQGTLRFFHKMHAIVVFDFVSEEKHLYEREFFFSLNQRVGVTSHQQVEAAGTPDSWLQNNSN